MPATSSAPGSQPQAVAAKPKTVKSAVKSVVKSVAPAVSTGAAVARTASRAGRAVSTGVSYPEAPSYAAAKAVQRAEHKAQKVIKAKQRIVKRAIANDPPKAEKLVKTATKSIFKHLDTKGRPPQIKLGSATQPVKAHKPTVEVSKQDARKFFSPKTKVRKAARQEVVKAAVVAQRKAPSRQERKQAKTELRTAAKKSAKTTVDLSKIPEMGLSREVAPRVKRMAEKRGLQPSVLMAQLEQESGFNPLATEQGGSVSNTPSESQGGGISQFIPSTAANYGVKYGASKKAVNSQLRGQAKYMKALGGTTAEALGAYYGDHNPNGSYAQGILSNAQKYAALDEPAKKPKPIPKKTKQEAKQVLGAAKTKKVIEKARKPKGSASVSSAPKKLGGPLGGSREMVREIVGTKVKGDHGYENEGSVHSASGDHYGPGSYAQDINSASGNKAEGEPAYNQATLDKIVKNLRSQGADVPDLKIGENWEGSVKGYAVQVLTNEGGTVNHIHIGAHWAGTPTTAGSASGYASSSAVGSAVSGGTTAASVGQAVAGGKRGKAKTKAKRLEGRRRSQLLRKLIAEGPGAAESVVAAPSYTASERAPVKVSL